MKIPKPRFELARVYSDGTKEVEIVSVTDIPLDTTTGRREFLATSLTAAAALGIMGMGCSTRTPVASRKERSDCAKRWSHARSIQSLAISPDGRILASGSGDKTIKLWELPTGTLRKTLNGHVEGINALAISPNSGILSSGGFDKFMILWDLTSGEVHKSLAGHTNWTEALAISPDSRILASGSEDKTIKLWELPAGTLRQTLTGHTMAVDALAISPDSRTLVSGGGDRTIRLWNLSSGEFQSCLTDVSVTPSIAEVNTYQHGQYITDTLPCGSPIPPGATCTCNCVPVTYSSPKRHETRGIAPCGSSIPPGAICTCNCVCTCLAV